MPEIASFDFLIGPFGYSALPRKSVMSEWKRIVSSRASKPGTMFWIVHDESFALRNFVPAQREQILSFLAFAQKALGKRFVQTKPSKLDAVVSSLKSQGVVLPQRVRVNCFGKHAGICVETGVAEIIPKLKAAYPGTSFAQRTLYKSSELSNSAHVKIMKRMLAKHQPELLKEPGAEVLLRMYADSGITSRRIRQSLPLKSLHEMAKVRQRRRR